MWLSKEQLWKLRRQIVLGSLYYYDYVNTFGIDPHLVCDFFDSFLSFVEEQMQVDIPNYVDRYFFNLLPVYDNAERLLEWYACYEANPLPLPIPDEEDEAA